MIQSIFVVDMAAMVSMVVLANLSKRLGEALKIRSYYRMFYLTTVLVFAAFGIDTFHEGLRSPFLGILSISLRAAGAALALLSCLPYWKWIFPEYFHRRK